jgi:hypothetical protein
MSTGDSEEGTTNSAENKMRKHQHGKNLRALGPGSCFTNYLQISFVQRKLGQNIFFFFKGRPYGQWACHV